MIWSLKYLVATVYSILNNFWSYIANKRKITTFSLQWMTKKVWAMIQLNHVKCNHKIWYAVYMNKDKGIISSANIKAMNDFPFQTETRVSRTSPMELKRNLLKFPFLSLTCSCHRVKWCDLRLLILSSLVNLKLVQKQLLYDKI